MCQLPARRQTVEPGGFTLIEVLVSISILAIGLMAAALLLSTTYRYSARSRYVAEAAQLASEKLEDLGRLPQTDAHVTVTTGATCTFLNSTSGTNCEGNLSQDGAPQTITMNGTPYTVNYYDTVFLSGSNNGTCGTSSGTYYGQLEETYQTATGPAQYQTIMYPLNGQTPCVSSPSSTAPTAGQTFDRRWVIEQDQPVTGVRRVTVLVTLMDKTVQPPVTFQMTMVRP